MKVKSLGNQGLTLIEVLVAMGIATVAGVLLLVIIVNSAGIFSQQSSKVTEGLNINDTLARVRQSIKQASRVVSQYTSGSTTYNSSTNQLVLKVASVTSSGSIIDNTFDYFIFFLDQNTLHFKIFPDISSSRKAADQILSTSVGSITFTYFNSAIPPVEVVPKDATKVRVILSLEQRAGASIETTIATSEANLRND